MKIYNPVYADIEPSAIEITKDKVFIANNIEQVERSHEGIVEQCYKFSLTEYEKDEYIAIMAQKSADIAALQEELEAAKIILGVE